MKSSNRAFTLNMDLQNTPECFKGWQVTAFLMMWGSDLSRRMFQRSAEIGGVLKAGKKRKCRAFRFRRAERYLFFNRFGQSTRH